MVSLDIEEQYDTIYRYCYFRLHSRELAEDVTQETFFRYFENYNDVVKISALKYLYTIARNLCVDEYRKPKMESLEEAISDNTMEEKVIANLAVKRALSRLTSDEQELLLLRYENEVPVSTLANIYGVSRFVIYRKITSVASKFREELRKEEV